MATGFRTFPANTFRGVKWNETMVTILATGSANFETPNLNPTDAATAFGGNMIASLDGFGSFAGPIGNSTEFPTPPFEDDVPVFGFTTSGSVPGQPGVFPMPGSPDEVPDVFAQNIRKVHAAQWTELVGHHKAVGPSFEFAGQARIFSSNYVLFQASLMAEALVRNGSGLTLTVSFSEASGVWPNPNPPIHSYSANVSAVIMRKNPQTGIWAGETDIGGFGDLQGDPFSMTCHLFRDNDGVLRFEQ